MRLPRGVSAAAANVSARVRRRQTESPRHVGQEQRFYPLEADLPNPGRYSFMRSSLR